MKYLTIKINQILPKLLIHFHPSSLLTSFESKKKLTTKSIFKYQNRILQSKHVFVLVIAKKFLCASFRHKRKEEKRGRVCEKKGTSLNCSGDEVAKICSHRN